jgi:hypothetical protein
MQSRLRPIGANGEGFAARFLLARRDMGYPAVTQGLEDNPMTVWLSEDEKEAMVTALIDKLGRLPPQGTCIRYLTRRCVQVKDGA